jgi:hypothetical protein
MTGDEFIVVHNNTSQDIDDLSMYWLMAYNNVNPLASGVSSSTQQLPQATLYAGETLLLSANPMQTCGASVAGKLSLSLSDSGGFLQIVETALSDEGAVMQAPHDVVSWSSGANGIIQNMPSNTKNPRAVYFRYLNGDSFAWQQAEVNAPDVCQLNIVVAGGSGSSSAVTPLNLAATSPPATIMGTAVASADGDAVIPQMPPGNVGLLAPQISELLPNPAGTGNDSTDEFIELYNPNDKSFDLTGSSLQVGTTTLRLHTFAPGSELAPKSFRAFYAEETKLSLSNTASQVTLLDPFGNPVSTSDSYAKAKDGIAWVVAKNKWYWTTKLTPGLANIVQQPATKTSAKSTAKKKTAAKKVVLDKDGKPVVNSTATASHSFTEEILERPIHTLVLALIGVAALLYGAYEYRRDIANRLHQLGAKLGFGRKHRTADEGRRSD